VIFGIGTRLAGRQDDGSEAVPPQSPHVEKTNGQETATAKQLIFRPFKEETHMNFASVY
jgi:hypothetical protein